MTSPSDTQRASDEQVSAIGLLREWLLASDDFDFEVWVRKVRDLVEDGSEAGCLSRPAGGGAAEQPAPVGESSTAQWVPGINEQIDLEYTRRKQLADRLTWPQPVRADLDAAIAIIHCTLPVEMRDE